MLKCFPDFVGIWIFYYFISSAEPSAAPTAEAKRHGSRKNLSPRRTDRKKTSEMRDVESERSASNLGPQGSHYRVRFGPQAVA